MTQLPTVTLIGHVCIDNNTIEGAKFETWGSSVMYIAKYLLKNFGIHSHIIAPYGQNFVKYTESFDFLVPPTTPDTLQYENIVNNGTRVQYCHHAELSNPVTINEKIKELLEHTDILVVAPLVANYQVTYIAQIMEFLPKECLRVLLPQGYMRHINGEDRIEKRMFSEAEQLLTYFDVVVASDEDCDNALDVAKVWATYKEESSIVITQASKGATLFNNGKVTQIPTTAIPPSQIKNPVGSGDTFSARLAIDLHNKLSPSDAVRNANAATAKVLLSQPIQ